LSDIVVTPAIEVHGIRNIRDLKCASESLPQLFFHEPVSSSEN